MDKTRYKTITGDGKIKWHCWPEAIYTIHYGIINISDLKVGEDSVVSILVDATDFMQVEDFAKDTCPEGYEVNSIEKAYYGFAEMFGGSEGCWIDVQLNGKDPVLVIYGDIEKHDGEINKRVVAQRSRFKVEIASNMNAVASA